MYIGQFVDFKQTVRVKQSGRDRVRKVGVEGVNFMFHFWSDKSTKWATKDGKNSFRLPLIGSNLQTSKKLTKNFRLKILKKKTRGTP